MGKMKSVQEIGEHRWLGILAARMALWSLTLGVLWALPVVILAGMGVGTLLLYEANLPPVVHIYEEDRYAGFVVIILLMFAAFFATLALVLGAIQGAFAGFYAPPRESTKPFQSQFFRLMGKRGAALFALSFAVAPFGAAPIGFVGGFEWSRNVWLFLLFCGFIWSTRAALQHAQKHVSRAATPLPVDEM